MNAVFPQQQLSQLLHSITSSVEQHQLQWGHTCVSDLCWPNPSVCTRQKARAISSFGGIALDLHQCHQGKHVAQQFLKKEPQGGCFSDSTDCETSVKAVALHRLEITTGSGDFFSARYFLILDISGKVCLFFIQQQSCWMLPRHLSGASWTHKSENSWFSKVLLEKTFIVSLLFEFSYFPFLCFFTPCWSVCSSPPLLQSISSNLAK